MITMEEILNEQEHLEHWGILGMKWGIRRYQNPDGSLTAAGRARYERQERKKQAVMQSGNAKKVLKYQKKLTDEEFDKAMIRVAKSEQLKKFSNAERDAKRAEKDAKQSAKDAKKLEKDKLKLSEQEIKNAQNVVKDNSGLTLAKIGGVLTAVSAVAAPIIKLWKDYKSIGTMVSDLTGAKLPGIGGNTLFGKKDDKDDKDGDKKGPKPEPKSEKTSDKAKESTFKSAKDTFDSFRKTSTSSDTFKETVSSGVSVEGEGRSRDSGFFRDVSDIFDTDWSDIRSTPVSEVYSIVPAGDKWWLK